MVLPLEYIVLVTIYINIPGYYLIQSNKSLFSLNLQCSVYEYCYLNVSFFQGTVLDYLPDFLVINEQETYFDNYKACY